jgi:hypothetical protein
MLGFHFGLIQPFAFNLLTCECGHGLETFGTRLPCCPFGGQRIATHNAIQDIMYAFVRKNGHVVWKKWWYAFTLRISLQFNLYMTRGNQVFVVDVVDINLTLETMVSSVIIQSASAIAKFSAIAKIRKYRGLHEGHHFILMAMEVHNALRHDMDHFIRECAHLFHDR